MAHEFAEFIEPVYFVAWLGNTRVGAQQHYLRSTLMPNESLPIVDLSIHFPSCKIQGILSDDFAEEIKKSINDYEFKFSFTPFPVDAYYPCGIASLSGVNISGEEFERLNKIICLILSQLAHKQAAK